MTGTASSDRILVGSVVVEHDVDQHSRRNLPRDGIEALDERPVPRAQAVLAGGGAVEPAQRTDKGGGFIAFFGGDSSQPDGRAQSAGQVASDPAPESVTSR